MAVRTRSTNRPAATDISGGGGPRPLRKDAAANRQRILDAAAPLMAERGLNVPLEDIANAAGVGIGTFYRRFPTRDDLIGAIFESRVADVISDFQHSFEIEDGWDALIWLIRTTTQRRVEDRALSELLEQDRPMGNVSRVRERIEPLARRVLERARATGRLRPDFEVGDMVLIQNMLAGVGIATYGIRPDLWERTFTMVIDGLVVARSESTPARPAALTSPEIDALLSNETR